MFPRQKHSRICPKSLYFQRNPQLYSCVCCIKESSLNLYSARPDGQFDMQQHIIRQKYNIFKAILSFIGLTFQENIKFQNLKYFEKACELRLKCIT